MADRIYPVPIKPASNINSWDGWPDDVRDTLWSWNHGRIRSRLSFRRSPTGSIYEPSTNVFKCYDCKAFCQTHRHGAAVVDGHFWVCDDCLIARARASTAASREERP